MSPYSLMAMQTTVPGARATGRLERIQILRAYAAWLVVLHHFHQVFNAFDRSTVWGRVAVECGAYAVYVFFIISGLIIHQSLKRRQISAWGFLRRRMLRIALPYWVATALFTLLIFVLLPEGRAGMWSTDAMMMSLSFVAFPHPSGAGLYPVLPVGWSLNYEALFYVLVAASLVICNARWALGLGLVLVIMPWLWPSEWAYGLVLNQPLWLLFPLGMALSQWIGPVQPCGRHSALAVCAVVLLTSLLLASPLGTSVALKMAAAGALVGLVLWCGEGTLGQSALGRLVVQLGDWSYATYLVHMLVLFSIQRSPWMPAAQENKVVAFATYGVSVLLASWIFYRWVERPVLSLSAPKESKKTNL